MTTVAVLPVKRFDRAKQRLASGLAGTSREVLAEAMLRDVLGALAPGPVAVRHRGRDRRAARAGAGARARRADRRGRGRDRPERGRLARRRPRGRVRRRAGPDGPRRLPGARRHRGAGAHRRTGRRPGRDDRARPPRHRDQRAAARAAGRHRARVRRGIVRAPSRAGRGRRARGSRVAEVASLALDVDTPEDLDALRERASPGRPRDATPPGSCAPWPSGARRSRDARRDGAPRPAGGAPRATTSPRCSPAPRRPSTRCATATCWRSRTRSCPRPRAGSATSRDVAPGGPRPRACDARTPRTPAPSRSCSTRPTSSSGPSAAC